MTDDQANHIQVLLKINRDSLRRLEKQIALHGGEMGAPIHLLSQRDEILAEIERLEAGLRALKDLVTDSEAAGENVPPPTGGDLTGRGNLAGLHKKIDRYFDREELRTLCFELGVDYDSLPAEGKAAKVRELVQHCERHGLTEKLLRACASLRPHVAW
jgi:hypothetical protein